MDTWREVVDYVGFGPADSETLRALLPVAQEHLAGISERFYEAILANDRAAAVFTGPDQVERLKKTLAQWMLELLSGPHDSDYWERRRRIGHVHVRVGLPSRYVFGAMNVIRAELLLLAKEHLPLDQAWATCLAIQRITDVELAVMSGTYHEAHEAKVLAGLQAVIVENLPITVLCLDRNLQVTSASQPPSGDARALTSYVSAALIAEAELIDQLERALVTGHQVSLPRVETPDKRLYRVTILALDHPLARLMVHVDEVTDAVQGETRLKEAEHLAQIGSLAANVAHEIRNPLAAISATLQVIVGSMPQDDRRRGVLDKVQQHVLRLDRLVTDLLSYARPVEVRPRNLDLAACAQESLTNSAVAAELTLHDTGGQTLGDAFYVQQILVNLLQNARDAAGDGGSVHLDVGPGPILVVRDSGPGIGPELLDTLFDPFVTTKTRGTGLGLAISRKLARAMGGGLRLRAPRGELGGAEFELRLAETLQLLA